MEFRSTAISFLQRVCGSPRFFYGVAALLVLQALWIALSAVYPMAFDEDFHLGIIKIYAGQWLPFLAQQPPGADAFGAAARDPSYLFHYLMSFPYRLAEVFTDSQTVIVIALRLINIALFAGALVLWRRVLLAARLSPALTHILLLLFVLIPIVPPLAAQINYDNLLLLLMAWMCLLAADILARLSQRELPLQAVWTLLLVGLFASLVKYAFLPIFAAAVLFVAVYGWLQLRGRQAGIKRGITAAWSTMGRTAKVIFILLSIMFAGLALERYGGNLVAYGHPVPDCGAVLTVEQCSHYGPWGRDYLLAITKGEVDANPIIYLGRWLYGMWYRLFFAVNGNVGIPAARYQNFPPLPLVGVMGLVLSVAGMIAAAWQWRAIRERPLLLFFVTITAAYCVALWLQNYQMYLETGQAVAVNGRYLLLIVLPVAVVTGVALSRILHDRPRIAYGLATLAVIAFLQGGLTTFIVRSNSNWYWSSPVVREVNQTAQQVIRPLVPGQSISWPSP